MTDYLDLACSYHGVDKGKVIKHRDQVGPDGSDDYSIIVDNGILGCPKYYVPISLLEEIEAEAEAALEVMQPAPAASDLNYQELQALIIVDNGILGCPKYYVPISHLEEIKAEAEAALEVMQPAPAASDLNYRELQALAKEAGIPANQSADELNVALWEWSEEEE